MNPKVEAARRRSLDLLETTRRATRAVLAHLNPDLVVHMDERAWSVRDVIGHLGVWNAEAARSLSAYSKGEEYFCITADTKYDEYNGPAADARSKWTMDELWAEYESSHDQLKLMVEIMPAEKWEGEMLYPWSERGTVEQFIKRMMKHETKDHCDLIVKVTTE